ncbi:MATE family efflux transporter [Rhizobium sp. 'Codium 1']|uniref:MATE family efflux transporter n=1 Tax=Rhizobium sp. 'Codium 1' TaxID=2940484 RepID=UPI001E5FA335|nr:MATE family efflux transporter [Rhizobium sp. 'Codium 1']MCC8931987.1 hypothetical protein [Rhizobium sp. 'Codium 1']
MFRSSPIPVTEGPTARHVFALAWPMTLKAIMLHGTVVIDTYLVSSLGESAIAAMGLSTAVAGLVLGAILAFANAMQIRTAQAFGTNDRIFLKSVFASGMAVSLAIGLIGLTTIFLFGDALLDVMAPTVEIGSLAKDYLAIFSLVILGEAIGQVISSHFNGCGRTRLPLYSFLLAVPINIASSIVLIHGFLGLPAFGVAGAAMGSAIAVTAQVSYLILRFARVDGGLLRLSGWRQSDFAATLRRHLGFSLPIAATFFSATFAMQVSALIYARLSLNEFAAMTIIGPWIMVTGTVGMQWAQATGIIVAQLLGQKTEKDVLERFLASAWRGAFVASGAVAVLLCAVCLSADWLYSDLGAETRVILLGFLPVLLILPFPKGSNAICGNTLRASGDTVYVMHIFIWAQWLFRIPATAIAVLYLQLPAAWVLSIQLWEEFLKFPAFHRRLHRGDWKDSEVSE